MSGLINQPIVIALTFSVALHAFALFGIRIVLPDVHKTADSQPLQVVLVNSKTGAFPTEADALAQHNLDGGGNTSENRVAKTPFPALSDDKQFKPEQSARRIQQLEQESRLLITQAKSSYTITQEKAPQPQEATVHARDDDLVEKSIEIARLEAQIEKDMSFYQKMPRKRFIGARAKEYRDAQYIEAWRIKVERFGNLNYPEMARQKKIYGSLQLTVEIRADGNVESVEVTRSSGQPILDAAAQYIVKKASPFSPFPADIRRDTDILSITRTWTFTQSDELQSE